MMYKYDYLIYDTISKLKTFKSFITIIFYDLMQRDVASAYVFKNKRLYNDFKCLTRRVSIINNICVISLFRYFHPLMCSSMFWKKQTNNTLALLSENQTTAIIYYASTYALCISFTTCQCQYTPKDPWLYLSDTALQWATCAICQWWIAAGPRWLRQQSNVCSTTADCKNKIGSYRSSISVLQKFIDFHRTRY